MIAYAVGAVIVALVWISALLTRADRRRRLLEEARDLTTRRDLAPDADL